MVMQVNEQTLAAHNEAGHGIEAVLQGRDIGSMGIFPSINGDGSWGGRTSHDYTRRHAYLYLPPEEVYERLERAVPEGFTDFKAWECCAYFLTAVEAEKRLCELNSIDSSTQRIAKQDVEDAQNCVAGLPPERAQSILNEAQAQARRVVEDSDCWRAIENLAQALIDASERTEQPYLTTREIHEVVSQVLPLPPLDDDII